MSAKPFGQRFSARMTPAHFVTLPTKIKAEFPLSAEDRIVPPPVEANGDLSWYVAAVAPAQERKALRSVTEAGYVGYVPMDTLWLTSERFKRKVKREIQRPMLRGYLFLGIDERRITEDGEIVTEDAVPAVPPQQTWDGLEERDIWGQNVHGIVAVMKNQGKRSRLMGKALTALARLAAEEAEGWYDESRKAGLEAAANPEKARPLFEIGEACRVSSGAFATFPGIVESVDEDRGRLRLAVDIFGRPTPVELEFGEVENTERPKEISRRSLPIA